MRLDEIRTSITNLIVFLRLNSLNSKCVLNIGNGPQSDPLLHSGVKDRQTAHQFTIEPKAAKRPISVQCGQKPQSGSLLCREAFIRYLVHFRHFSSLYRRFSSFEFVPRHFLRIIRLKILNRIYCE